MSLTEYERKRHFQRTREPAPGKRRGPAARPIFVVQLHHASHRHYDFRLQVGDALKSWAVPKGPSLDPTVKRLAAEVEDHPLDYAGFEGEIPEGEYGGGHVAVFDHGLWSTDGDPRAQLAKGHLRFELFGDKLKGGWHLVRTPRGGRKPQWLLFKQDDAYADAREADDMLDDLPVPTSGASARRASRAAVAKKAGKSAAKSTPKAATRKTTRARKRDWSTIASKLAGARRATLSDAAFAPQLATLGESPPSADTWLHEAKWDGYRLLTVVKKGRARIWSRNALEWTAKVPEIARAVEALAAARGIDHMALDGELIAGGGTQADFGVLQATLSGEKNAPLSYLLFDLIHLQDHDLRKVAQIDRKQLLEQVLSGAPLPLAYSSHVQGHGEQAFAAAGKRELEGIISKRADAPYRAGRSDDWRKTKRLESDEFAVVGMTAPRGSRSGFGSLLLARPDGKGGWSYAGRVGTGFSQTLITELSQTLGKRRSAKPTVHLPATLDVDLRHAQWFAPQAVVEVYFRGIGNQGLLRQPSLKGMRPDKRARDLLSSDRGTPTAGADMATTKTSKVVKAGKLSKATKATKATKASKSADADTITISNPGRVVYPDTGKTKQEVANYYDQVMDWLLPEIVGRPLSIIRCPQGSTRPCFFQKHLVAGMKYVDSVPLKEESGQVEDYLVVRTALAVRELVQFNVLEFHPWGAQARTPERADRVVFDLDPAADVPWSEVVAAARQMRGLLKQAGFVSYVRTTGGKGLHVVMPLKPACDWDIVKAFAHSFADSMAQLEPLKFLATASKKLRKGRIFIDYLRNGRGATSVASFSLRARPGAPVAMPLKWEELGRVQRGDAFDIDSAVARMRRWKAHPWQGIDEVRQNLKKIRGR
ncbi:MAG TPA: DNA ligase D [Pseudoxanthomonas sp.]|nr:DNA ligase D [Pseudoxanthomonas sp.]